MRSSAERFWKRLLATLLALALPLAGGCQRQADDLRVGTNVWIGYETLYLADQLGYYGGEPIRLVTMHNATEIQQALRAGVLEVATLTLDEALNLVQEGMDVRVIAVMDVSDGADALIAHPSIATLADLRGRRIGVESTAVGAVMLEGALQAAGLQPGDMEIVDMGVQEHGALFTAGRVDAVVTFEPVRSELLKQGGKVLFDSSRIPGRVVDVLVTTPQVARERAGTLRTLVAGHFRALGYFQAQPLQAAAVMSRRQGMTAEEIVKAYEGIHIPDLEGNRRYLSPPEPLVETSADSLAALMLQSRLLRRSVDVHGMAEDAFLP